MPTDRSKTLLLALALGFTTLAFIVAKTGRDALFFQGSGGLLQLPLIYLNIGAASLPLAMLFAATYPERTTALVLWGTFATGAKEPAYPWGLTPAERDELAEHWRDQVTMRPGNLVQGVTAREDDGPSADFVVLNPHNLPPLPDALPTVGRQHPPG